MALRIIHTVFIFPSPYSNMFGDWENPTTSQVSHLLQSGATWTGLFRFLSGFKSHQIHKKPLKLIHMESLNCTLDAFLQHVCKRFSAMKIHVNPGFYYTLFTLATHPPPLIPLGGTNSLIAESTAAVASSSGRLGKPNSSNQQMFENLIWKEK